MIHTHAWRVVKKNNIPKRCILFISVVITQITEEEKGQTEKKFISICRLSYLDLSTYYLDKSSYVSRFIDLVSSLIEI